jgi:hypothetical protein
MTKFKSIQLILLILSVVSFSCNKVKETPEPDTFSQTPLQNLNLVADSGKASIDIVAANQIKTQVSVRFDQPKHGSLYPESGSSRFLYRAKPGFEGRDTVGYEVCKTGFCKKGIIGIFVKNNPLPKCSPSYAQVANDTFYLNIPASTRLFYSGFFPGDRYCKDNVRKIEGFSPDFSEVAFQGDSIRMRTTRNFLRNTDLLVLYSNSDTSTKPASSKVRILKVTILVDHNYCDDLFDVADRTMPLSVFGDTLKVSPTTFFQAVTSCYNDLDQDYFEVYTSPNLRFSKLGKLFKIYRKPGAPQPGPRFVYYIYRNLRQVADTGRQEIIF